MANELTADIALTKICGQRDESIRLAGEAAVLIAQGHELAKKARDLAAHAADGTVCTLRDRRQDASYKRLFESFDADASTNTFRRNADACIWMHLVKVTGMEVLMDATAREEFYEGLCSSSMCSCVPESPTPVASPQGMSRLAIAMRREAQKPTPDPSCQLCQGRGVIDVPEVNEENILATLQGLHQDSGLVFQRGLARAFSGLDKRFKSHDAFKLGSRVIISHLFDSTGFMSYHTVKDAAIADIERVLAVLDGEEPAPGALKVAIRESRSDSWGPRQSYVETPYLRIRCFKNGNAHLWFTRDDLVEKANLVLADYYGAVLPDGVPADEPMMPKSGLPARNLSFYATPAPVVDQLLKGTTWMHPRTKVLEPSAGTGNIARELLIQDWDVTAVEIDPRRAGELRQLSGLSVRQGNFLLMRPRPEFAAVIMNPPFYGTHWIEHVVHAFKFLELGGFLRAVLPITVELGETKAHKAFRTWAEERSPGYRQGMDIEPLPPESFASSGTRINTVILSLRKIV